MSRPTLVLIGALPPQPDAPEVCDTTRLRHLGLRAALADRWDLLFGPRGLTVPRVVADPDDPTGLELLDYGTDELSEIAGAERHFYTRWDAQGDQDALMYAQALQRVRQHADLRLVEPDQDEADTMAALANRAFSPDAARRVMLGRGERSVLAIADNREWIAGLDEAAARQIALEWGLTVITTQDALRRLVTNGVLGWGESEDINDRMIQGGFHGAQPLHDL